MDTTKGRVLIETAPEFAPNHVSRFTTLMRTGFYDGIIFHRVIDDFMVQGGDPDGTGMGGTGTNIDAEFYIDRGEDLPVVEVSDRDYNRGGFWHGMPVVTQPSAQLTVLENATVESWISHCPGVMSTARSDNPNSADSQFFMMRRYINDRGQANTFLDKQYTAWGHVVGGLDVVRSMNVGTVRETPGFEPDAIVTAKIAADLDEAERPRVWVLRENGPAFAELIDEARNEYGDAPDVCEIEIPTIVEDGSQS
jgi:peptidylprolyl isomerase